MMGVGSNPGSVCSRAFNGSGSITQNCNFGLVLQAKTAWTEKNYGRKFLGCPNFNKQGTAHCRFFQWVDEPVNIPREYIIKMKQLEEGLKMSTTREEKLLPSIGVV